ncbi:NAD(P)/FAD-dependent oxidoreductase [Chloroflexota bacterium]
MQRFDVIIVGGGPVGSHVASRLADMGYYTAVLERRKETGLPVCCTGIISEECVRSFAIDNSLILRRVNSAKIFSPGGILLRLWRPKVQACVLDRVAFNVALAHRAVDSGAKYLTDHLVSEVIVSKDKVLVRVSRDGEELQFEAKAVVLASGFRSNLVTEVGLEISGIFAMGVQTEVSTASIDEIEIYFGKEVSDGLFAWLVPTTSNKARIGLLSYSRPGEYLKKLLSSLQEQGKINSVIAKTLYRAVPLKTLPKTYQDRLLVVGDAAGQVKPTTGGGIYYGLLCADIAADTLNQALINNDLTARNLTEYESKWENRLEHDLKSGQYARIFQEKINDKQMDRIFDITISLGLDKSIVEREDISFDGHSQAILKLLGHSVLAKAFDSIKVPFISSR